MKKIYILTAVFALLSLSLNAQSSVECNQSPKQLSVEKKTTASDRYSFNKMLAGIKGMSGILQAGGQGNASSSAHRAPLKINSDEVTVGPFTGDNFDNGLGFGNAYSQPQYVLIATELANSEYANHIGDEIVGFRFALAGDATSRVKVAEFVAFPTTSSGGFDQDHLYEWPLGEFGAPDPVTQYVKVTSTSDITNGEYLIVNESASKAFNGASTTPGGTGTNAIDVTISNSTIESNSTTDAATVTIDVNAGTIKTASGLYIYRATGTSGGALTTSNTAPSNTNAFSVTSGNATITCTGNSRYYYLRFNSSSSQFRYYTSSTSQQNIQLYKKVTTSSVPEYVELAAGQWHEYYLDEPVPFQVGDNNAGLFLGYYYIQYPTGTSGEDLFPIAVNSQSTTHDHYAFLTTETTGDITITVPSYYTRFQYIRVYDNDTDNLLTSWSADETTYTFEQGGTTYTYYEMPDGWTLSNVYMFNSPVTVGQTETVQFGYLSTPNEASITIDSSKLNGCTNVRVEMYVAAFTSNQYIDVNGDSHSLTSGYVSYETWNTVDFSQTSSSTGWQYFDFSNYGDLAVQLIFKAKKPTPNAPTVTNQVGDENVTITITPDPNTDGNLVYYVDNNGNQVQDLTFPRGLTSYTVTVHAYTTATDNYNQSPEAVVTVTIPAAGGWTEMYGTYNNDNDLLSLQSLEIGDDGKHKEIMMVDQFLASTLYNTHSDHYTYSMRETVNNEEKSSNLVNIPVYKTSSTMQGFYTQGQVDTADLKMELKAQVINSKMTYDVNPDHNVLYYSLYRGSSDKNETYPVIDESHRVSQLQKFEEMVGNQVQYFMFENHQTGIVPRYDHVGNEIVERLDTNYVQGQYNSELSYVPVIWTYGLYTAREDGKNNSYGSDIKREKLGKTEIVTIGGSLSGNNNAENTGNGWEGYFYKDGVQYCIYTPIFEIEGTTPEKYVQHDGDTSKYVPYMYRVWCLYDGAIDFGNDAQGLLVGGDPIKAPFLLGQELVTDPNVNRVTIGRNWTSGQGRLQNAFAVPRSTAQADVEFAVRFYYKKIVTQKAQAPSGLRGNRDGVDEEEEYYIVEDTGNGQSIPVMINEFLAGKTITSVTYVNAQGMTSSKPFSGLNIVITKFSDGSTSTTKVMR